MRELAERHGIPPDRVKELQDRLVFSVDVALAWGEVRRERARLHPERKRQAQRRKRAAKGLEALVSDLLADPDTLRWLLFEIELLATERGNDLCVPIWKALQQTLGRAHPLVELLYERVKETRSAEQRGEKGNLEINMFVYSMAKYYDEEVGRFTLDYHRGKALTKPFEFLRDAAKPAFSVSETQLITAARKAITELRAHRKKHDRS